MGKYFRQFPLIPDDEPVILPVRQMQLYDEADFITNIRGPYTERFVDEEDLVSPSPTESSPVRPQASTKTVSAPEVSATDRARQEARADLKRKRQAMVMRETTISQKPKPQAPVVKGEEDEKTWGYYAKALRQTDYILAELPRIYEQPQNPSTQEPRKQNFDFLKNSQVYNHRANQRQKERQVAQELNLSTFDDND